MTYTRLLVGTFLAGALANVKDFKFSTGLVPSCIWPLLVFICVVAEWSGYSASALPSPLPGVVTLGVRCGIQGVKGKL